VWCEAFPKDLPRPSLYPPEGLDIEYRHGGGREEAHTYSAEIPAELSLTELAAHYAGELEREGWTMIDQNNGAHVVRQSWRFEDASGERWSGVFLASEVPNASRQSVVFHISKP